MRIRMHLLLLVCLSMTCSSTSSYTTDNDWWSPKMNKSDLLNRTSTINGSGKIPYFPLIIYKKITSPTFASGSNHSKSNKASSSTSQSPSQTPIQRHLNATIWDSNSTKGQSSKAGIIIQFNHPKILKKSDFHFEEDDEFVLYARLWYEEMRSHSVQFLFSWRGHCNRTNLSIYNVHFHATIRPEWEVSDSLNIYYKPGQHIHILLQQHSICVSSNNHSDDVNIDDSAYRQIYPDRYRNIDCFSKSYIFFSTVSAISFDDSLQYVTWIQYTKVPLELHSKPQAES